MGRTNMEDSLRKDGNLSKLARVMGWCESKAGGRLWFFYRNTQKAGIVAASVAEITTVVLVDFDDRDEVKKWCAAMVDSALAEWLDTGELRIFGNEKHTKRITTLYDNAKKGGEARQKQIREKANNSTAGALADGRHMAATASHIGALPTPYSLLLPSTQSPRAGVCSEGPPPAILEEASREAESRPDLQARPLAIAEPIETTIDASAMKIPVDHAKDLVEHHRKLTAERRQISHPLMILPRELLAARYVLAMSGGDLSVARRVVKAYVHHDGRDHWKSVGWSLTTLRDPRDYDRAVSFASKPANAVRTI